MDGDGAGFADVLTHQKGVELTARMIGLFPEIETSKIITALVVHADVVASKKHTKVILCVPSLVECDSQTGEWTK